MRLPYAPESAPANASDEDKAVYERIAARRAPRPLLPLDRAMLHAPAVADGYSSFLGAIRTKTTIPAEYLELVISRIAVLNRAAFEWRSHCSLALKAGVSPSLLEIVKKASFPYDWAMASHQHGDKDVKLSEKQSAVLAYADAMTRNVTVEDSVFEAVKAVFEDRQVVELTAAVAAYNCVSRFLVALDVSELNAVPVEEWKVE